VDIKRDEMQFQVTKIAASRAQFRNTSAFSRRVFRRRQVQSIKFSWLSSRRSSSRNQPAYQAFKRIQTKTIPFNHLDLKTHQRRVAVTAEKITNGLLRSDAPSQFFQTD